jgi:LysM repeat protein
LGRHSKPPRIRLPQATAGAAGPTLAGVAAAICLSPQAPAAASVMPSASAHHATVPQAYQRGPTPAQLLAVAKHAMAHKTGSDLPTWYTVRSGDTLSSIAKREYHNSSAWPVLYWRNHAQVRWANVITAGQKLRIPREPAHIPAAPKQLAPAPAHTATHYQPRHARPATTTTEEPTQSTSSAPSTSTSSWSGSYPGGSFGACVVARESGGNSQVMNSTGHYGLYQFSASTWAAYGGNPADFGHASVAEQNQVFANALAQGGQSNWSPYDGC